MNNNVTDPPQGSTLDPLVFLGYNNGLSQSTVTFDIWSFVFLVYTNNDNDTRQAVKSDILFYIDDSCLTFQHKD